MKGVTKAAKKASGLSRKCAICPVNKTCTSIIQRVCSDAFVEGYKKGAQWIEKQNKKV